MTSKPSLRALQESFQRAVLDGDDRVLARIAANEREAKDVLLGVYRNAYVVRLIDFLRADYEKLALYLGDEMFVRVARSYIAAHPSATPNARWFGSGFPEHLQTDPLVAREPVIAELAGFERALNDAFDGPDIAGIGGADLAAVAPEQWAVLTFEPHPGVTQLCLASNALAVWQALDVGETPPQPKTIQQTDILVYRQEFAAHFRALAPEEAMMWSEAANGVAFGVLCEMVATFAGEEDAALRAAGYLQGWLQNGLIAAAHVGAGVG